MEENIGNEIVCLHLQGLITLQYPPNRHFEGVLKRGLRLVLWGVSYKKATSVSFVTETSINLGETQVCQIVLLSPQSIDKEIKLNESYFIGTPGKQLATFIVTKIIGQWEEKVP